MSTSTRVIAKARKIAAGMLEVDEADIAYGGGQFTVPRTDIAPLTFGALARMAYVGHKLPDGMEPGLVIPPPHVRECVQTASGRLPPQEPARAKGEPRRACGRACRQWGRDCRSR